MREKVMAPVLGKDKIAPEYLNISMMRQSTMDLQSKSAVLLPPTVIAHPFSPSLDELTY